MDLTNFSFRGGLRKQVFHLRDREVQVREVEDRLRLPRQRRAQRLELRELPDLHAGKDREGLQRC